MSGTPTGLLHTTDTETLGFQRWPFKNVKCLIDSAVDYVFEPDSDREHEEFHEETREARVRAMLSLGKLSLLKTLLMHLNVYSTDTE